MRLFTRDKTTYVILENGASFAIGEAGLHSWTPTEDGNYGRSVSIDSLAPVVRETIRARAHQVRRASLAAV